MFGVCDSILSDFCSDKTRKDLMNDDTLQILCGCHLKENEKSYPYSEITGGPSCDPICKYTGTIQNAAYPTCQSTNCVMDGITVNIVNSNSGDINFSQLCGSCGTSDGAPSGTSGGAPSGSCQCWFSNINVNQINSISGKINLSSNCGKCFITPPGSDGRQRTEVNCSTLKPITCKISDECGKDAICIAGQCVQKLCGNEFTCPSGQICDNGLCVDFSQQNSYSYILWGVLFIFLVLITFLFVWMLA